MHAMDDYRECKRENGVYCKFTFKLVPDRSDNLVWKIIQVSALVFISVSLSFIF